ncbi:MAG: DNA internalization-related competence protein ComEC/Rec2 [Symbiobacteriia bacterium]
MGKGFWLPPLLWVAAAFAAGVALKAWVNPPAGWTLTLVITVSLAAGVAAVAAGRLGRAVRPRLAAGILLLALVPAGLAYAWVRATPPRNAVAWLAQASPDQPVRPVHLVGVVRDEVKAPLPRRFLLQVETADGQQTQGLLLVRENPQRSGAGENGLPLRYGQRVQVDGLLSLPQPPGNPGEFDYAAYLRNQGVQALLTTRRVQVLGRVPFWRRWSGVFVALRVRLEAVLAAALPPEQAGLLAGLLFGSRGDLPAGVAEDFRLAGIYHILAVSGSNVAFVAMPCLAFLARLVGRRRALAGTAFVVVAFVLVTGAGASVMRAGVMAVLVLAAEAMGRPGGGVPALAAAILLLLGINPGSLWDPGFQLSVSATAGILFLAGPIELWLHSLPAWARSVLAVTVAAQIAVLPLSLAYWNGTSLVSLAANLLAAPLVEALVLLGSGLVLTGLVHPVLGRLVAWPVSLLLRLLTGGTHVLAGLPLAFVRVPGPRPWEVAGYYLALVLGFGVANLPRRRLLLTVLLVGLTVLRLWPAPPRLDATFIDVGQGDSAIIRLPDGRWLLVDGGGYQDGASAGDWDPGEKVVVPYLERLGVQRLDYVVATHPHADHVGGLRAVVKRFPVGELWWGGLDSKLPAHLALLAAVRDRGIPLHQVERGERLQLGEVRVTVLGPPANVYEGQRSDENANSVVLLLEYGQARLLLAADIEAPVEEDLLRSGLLGRDSGLTLLKVGHHGSRYASSALWLGALQPGAAVVSVGPNSFGHPARDTMGRLAQAGGLVLRTDRDGALLFRTDGYRSRLTAYRTHRTWNLTPPAAQTANGPP